MDDDQRGAGLRRVDPVGFRVDQHHFRGEQRDGGLVDLDVDGDLLDLDDLDDGLAGLGIDQTASPLQAGGNMVQIDLPELASGTYILTANGEQLQASARLIR